MAMQKVREFLYWTDVNLRKENKTTMIKTGIDDLALAMPSLYLPIDVLAEARDIEAAKLRHGLGLINMAICDTDEDVVTLAARAVIDLVRRSDLRPDQIGRIYVGTESSVDGSKPIASYVLGLLSLHFQEQGVDAQALKRCDVVDMTFACIGAIDAMHNSLAWLQTPAADGKVAIVVATDDAKYELASTGEYTQGAGAVAVLLNRNPKLLEVDLRIGVGTQDEHDFFKPLRLRSNDGQEDQLMIEHKDTPVFDGPFSNQTYANRIEEAWNHFNELQNTTVDIEGFSKYIFHLPYAYHGRRILADLYFDTLDRDGKYAQFLADAELQVPDESVEDYISAKRGFLKARTKSPQYKSVISNKIEQSERLSSHIGNVYTASIFLALASALYYSNEEDLADSDLLFFAYGSGSKSKVFQAKVKDSWRSVVDQWTFDEDLDARRAIDFEQYVALRYHKVDQPLAGCKEIAQEATGILPTNRFARYYNLSKTKEN